MLNGKTSMREDRHVRKEFFIGVDPMFYEPVHVHYKPKSELRDIVQGLIEQGGHRWSIYRSGVWSHVHSSDGATSRALPIQGWKIHVSATVSNCRDLLRKIAKMALENNLQFKYANDVNTMMMMTSKRWSRGGSGKFITIYPKDGDEFERVIENAYQLLKDDVGSYILSDKRYKDCRCLYYRYGGIMQATRLDYMGRQVPVLISPGGEEIQDSRNPYFETPSWTEDPFPIDESDGDDMALGDGRFVVKTALWFSNTGGVYLATDLTSGADVVVKEARPHVELSANDEDATSRLRREALILQKLAGTGVVPEVVCTFEDWENSYLVLEHLEARDMREIMLKHSPLLRVNPSVEDSAAFYSICKATFINLMKAVRLVHEQEMVIGDLAPTNVMVKESDQRVYLIDLEAAFRPGEDGPTEIYTPGFRPEHKRKTTKNSFEDDIYAISAIMMYSMFPIVALAFIRGDIFTSILPSLIRDIGWKNTPMLEVIQKLNSNQMSLDEAISGLEGHASVERPYAYGTAWSFAGLASAQARLAKFLLGNYRLDEKRTLFPADPFAGETNGLSIGFGSVGVMHVLRQCGIAVPSDAVDRHAKALEAARADTIPPGFLTGASGIAWALLRSGDLPRALRFIGHANESTLTHAHHSLYYGMAGIGMANIAIFQATGDTQYLGRAIGLAERLASSSQRDERGLHWKEPDGTVRIGFGYGQSGVALFLLRLSQVTGDLSWRDMGQEALQHDLSYAVEREPGVFAFGASPEETLTYEHYVEQGTAGIAKVALRYGLFSVADRLLVDIHRKYSAFAGLIYGLSGFVDVFVDAYRYTGEPRYLEMANRPLDGLRDVHFIEKDSGTAVPGDNLFRISCDFATGVAGVLRAVNRRMTLRGDEFSLDELDESDAGQVQSAVTLGQANQVLERVNVDA